MPSQFDIAPPGNWTEEDRKQYSRLPFWMAMTEHKAYSNWFVYSDMFPSFKWKQNQGDTLISVRPLPSPVASQVHRPRRMLEDPLINTYSTGEQNQQATIRRHRYMSNYMHWEGDFADFRNNQVAHAMKDLTRQISFGNEFFIRDQLIAQAKRIWVVGKGLVENVPSGESTATDPIKDSNFWANMISQIGSNSAGTLDFKTICMIRDFCENDLALPHWEGMQNKPADNEVLKGRYLLVGAGEVYGRLTYDASVTQHRPLAMNLLNSRFKGIIGENIVFRAERYPVRFKNDGTLPPLEIEVQDPSTTYGVSTNLDIVPHPDYLGSKVGLAILLGYAPMQTIDVGPPPSEFSGKGISTEAFNKLQWNGQVEATKNVLRKFADGSYDTNKFGDVLQLIAQTTHGAKPENPRFILPILYRRDPLAAASFAQ